MSQKVVYDYKNIGEIVDFNIIKRVMIVCSQRMVNSFIIDYFKTLKMDFVVFSDYHSNPLYEDVINGISFFKNNNCDFIIGLGGGSALDVSKCVKAFLSLDENRNCLEQEIIENNVSILAIPTTAGTGSESTHFAVIYRDGEKYSVAHPSILPNYVLLEPSLLESLPLYQRKSTLLDALCQGIESLWSVNSTEESKKYASETIKLILDNYEKYVVNDKSSYLNMLMASNLSGKAINISKTTAAHAMSYKLTSLYGISHGHAVALCLPHIWQYMVENKDKSKIDLGNIFNQLNILFNVNTDLEAINKFNDIFSSFNLESKVVKEYDLDLLVDSVNIQRLMNNPVHLDRNIIRKVYGKLC